jgi:hypothetical protein
VASNMIIAWQWDDGAWRDQSPYHPPTEKSVRITLARDGDQFSWTLDTAFVHSQATVGSLELALDQLKWAVQMVRARDQNS